MTKEELKLSLSDDAEDWACYQEFKSILLLKHLDWPEEEYKKKWIKLKIDAGLMDG